MKLSKSRHNIFSKVDHDKVFIEKNYNLQIQNGNNLNEDLPPLRLDVRKKIAYEQLKIKLKQKTTVLTHAKSLSSSNNITNECDENDYDDDNISIKSNYSEELENFKQSYETFNITDNLLDELGYIGQIKEELTDDDSDNHSEHTFTTNSDGKRKKFKSTIDVHKQFMNDVSMKGTLREIKSVGSLKKLVSSKDLSLKSQQLELLSSSNKSNNTLNTKFNELEQNNSFLFLSKLTTSRSIKQSTKSHTSEAMKSAIGDLSSPYSCNNSSNNNSQLKGYVVSPVGYTCNNSTTTAIISSSSSKDKQLPFFGKSISPTNQLVNSSLSIKTQLVMNKSLDTKGSLLNINKGSSNHAIIRTSTAMTEAVTHIDEIGITGTNSTIHSSPSKFHVPAIQAIHGGNKPILQKIDKLFHRMTSQTSDPKPKLEISPTKEVLTKESLFPEQLMKTNSILSNKDDMISDEMLKNLVLQTPLPYSSNTLESTHNISTTTVMLDKLDCILGRQVRDDRTTTTTTNSNNINTLSRNIPNQDNFESPLVNDKTSAQIRRQQQYPSMNNNNNSSNNQSLYEIDVHSLNLPNIHSTSGALGNEQFKQSPMICLYSPTVHPPATSSTNSISISTTMEKKHHYNSSRELLMGNQGILDSHPLLHSKHHSSSFNNPGTMYVPIVEEAQQYSSSVVNNNNHLYKQALNDETQQYISILQNISNDPEKHVLLNQNITSEIFNEEDNDSTVSQKNIPRSVTNATSDRGMYSIDLDQHRNLIPNAIPDLLDEGYIYQHATNSYVHRDDINHSRYGQYQRSQYISPWSKYQQSQWSEMDDNKMTEDLDPFSDRQFNEIEINTAGISVPVIYIPGNGNPVADPPPIIQQPFNQHHQYGNIMQGITALEPGDVVSDTNYSSVRSTMLYPNNIPNQSIHHHQSSSVLVLNQKLLLGHKRIDDGDNDDDSHGLSINTFGNNNSTTKTNKEIPSSPVVNRIKNQINDYINKLESFNSNQSNKSSAMNFNSISNNNSNNNNNLSNNENVDCDVDIARAKLWSKLNNRYSGDKEGTYNMKIKIKNYVFNGIKEKTQIENKYMSDLDDWF